MPKPSGDSVDKPRVLILSPEAPWPMHGGGAIRTASLVEYFGRRASTDLILFHERGHPHPPVPANVLQRVDFIELPPHRRDPLSRALRNLRRYSSGTPPLLDRFSGFEHQLNAIVSGRQYDLAIVEHFWCAPYATLLRPIAGELWLDLHNLESEWHQTLARAAPLPHRAVLARFARACRHMERELLPLFDLLLVPSDRDAASVREISPAAPTLLYPNALEWIAQPPRNEQHVIAFTGNLEYQPNIDAVRFFRRDVWPSLRRAHPQLRWRIIGRNPRAVERIVRGDESIELVGPVDDAIAELARAKVSVVPVRAGSGTRLKILEAWAAGTPVVSTSVGAQGLDAVPGLDLQIADNPRAFVDTISALLSSSDQSVRQSASGRRLYERRFTWPYAWSLLSACASETISRLQSLYTG